MLMLITSSLNLPWEGDHTCDKEDEINECELCEISAIWYQLAAQIMEFVSPRDELRLPVKDLPKVEELQHRKHVENQSRSISLFSLLYYEANICRMINSFMSTEKAENCENLKSETCL
jgi:hypothetical protein